VKTALVCDWLTGMRGGERCLDAVCQLFPDADIFTLVHSRGDVSQNIESHKIITSYIQKLPGKNFRIYLPLFPHAIQQFDLSGYDLILSFSHCAAKGVKVPEKVPHICYCHTPMRYAWNMRDEYLRHSSLLKKYMAQLILDYLKNWDRETSSSVTHFIANSRNVQNRIKQAYNRDSIVIYPPVNCNRFNISNRNYGYYLIVSAMVPYKRIDIAIRTFNTINRKLLIVGKGPELKNLKKIAKSNITFIESASDENIVTSMRNCRALIFPGEEDFGIVPLEAQASGKPVIAFGKGGALETVIGIDQFPENATGIFFFEQEPQALQQAISFFEQHEDKINPEKCRENAMKFDTPVYQASMKAYVSSVI
jgi:glycosyltransferase involved in cell wall biosynthesis